MPSNKISTLRLRRPHFAKVVVSQERSVVSPYTTQDCPFSDILHHAGSTASFYSVFAFSFRFSSSFSLLRLHYSSFSSSDTSSFPPPLRLLNFVVVSLRFSHSLFVSISSVSLLFHIFHPLSVPKRLFYLFFHTPFTSLPLLFPSFLSFFTLTPTNQCQTTMVTSL